MELRRPRLPSPQSGVHADPKCTLPVLVQVQHPVAKPTVVLVTPNIPFLDFAKAPRLRKRQHTDPNRAFVIFEKRRHESSSERWIPSQLAVSPTDKPL